MSKNHESRPSDAGDVHLPKSAPQGTHIPPHGHDHEYRDISFRGIWQFVITLVVVTVAVQFGLWGMFNILENRAKASDTEPSPAGPPPVAVRSDTLLISPRYTLANFRQMEDSVLDSYAWVDEQKGIAKIPVDVALEVISSRLDTLGPKPGGSDTGQAASGSESQAAAEASPATQGESSSSASAPDTSGSGGSAP